MSEDERSALTWGLTVLPFAGLEQWRCFLRPTGAFPLAEEQRISIQHFFAEIAETLTATFRMQHHLLFQTWKLSSLTGLKVISDNVRTWRPKTGTGVWPNRKPKDGWTEEMMVNAAAAVFKGEEPEIPITRLLVSAGSDQEQLRASSLMRGFGVQIQIFSKQSLNEMSAAATIEFRHLVEATGGPKPQFVFPLLDCASVVAAASDQQLSRWLCGADVYMRESAEDKAILLIMRASLVDAVLNHEHSGVPGRFESRGVE